VIATEGTVRGGAYQQAILRIRPDARVDARPAPLFVALAEEGLNEGPIANEIARHYLEPMFSPTNAPASVPDTLVLGCTHFPMLATAIRGAVGAQVLIVDSAQTTAETVAVQLAHARLTRTEAGAGWIRLLATDGRERFARVGSRFLERTISPDEVELVDL
jgi:glutamate racemase